MPHPPLYFRLMGQATPDHSFEDFVERCSGADTTDELFHIFKNTLQKYGYDRLIFSITRDVELGPEENKIGLMQNYPEDWQKYYLEKKFARIDPVLKYSATVDTPFAWDDLFEKLKLSAAQIRFMNQGEEAGLHNGVGVPLVNGLSQIAGVAVASSEKVDACHINHDLLNAYCHQFYMSYKRLVTPPAARETLILLSEREEEILKWISVGKTDEEISIILSISLKTVHAHTQNIYQKMGVHNRVLATVKAMMLGLLNPKTYSGILPIFALVEMLFATP